MLTTAVAVGAAAALPAQWKLGPDDYVSYSVDGRAGVEHIGFFGRALADGRRLTQEPTHPALLSLWCVTALPEKVEKGATVAIDHTFTRFEAFAPVRLVGRVTVTEAVGPLAFLEGDFRLRRVRAQSSDQRFFGVRAGTLTFRSQFDLNRGVMTEALVRYHFEYDERVRLGARYTGAAGKKKRRGVKLDVAHAYALAEVIPADAFRGRVDAWVDEQRDRLIAEWAGAETNENPALRLGYDALYTLALLHAHAPKTHAVVVKGWDRVRSTRVKSTYSAAMALLLAEAFYTPDAMLTDPERAAERKPSTDLSAEDRAFVGKTARYLIDGQREGGWGYYTHRQDRDFFADAGDGLDNSNTQLALMGLHAARRLGARVPKKTWTKAIGYWTRRIARVGFKPDGQKKILAGWNYIDNPREQSYTAMTAGALASATIIRAALGLATDDRSRPGTALTRVESTARAWLDHHISLRHGPRMLMPQPKLASYWAYHLWAIERAGGLGGVATFGSHDWYREGAMAIVNGTYASPGGDYVYEALCLLFLRRTSAAAVSPKAR